MSERTDADRLAERLLNEPHADPDDELRLLARQLLRRREVIERLENKLVEMQDDTLDLIHANRDSILRIHEQGLARIARAVQDGDVDLVMPIVRAVWLFHPMHGESWGGWPAGSKDNE